MVDIIKLPSTDKNYYLKKLKSINEYKKSKTYVLKIQKGKLNQGTLDTGEVYIKIPGGPFLTIGYKFDDLDYVIKSIDYIIKYGWTITFK